MKIIRLIDLIENKQDEEGNWVEEVKQTNFTLPTILDPNKVDIICPLFTSQGTIFKNVSYVKYDNEMMKVLGSPDYLNSLKDNKPIPVKGFHGKQEQTTIEDRATIKSKPQRGTKESS